MTRRATYFPRPTADENRPLFWSLTGPRGIDVHCRYQIIPVNMCFKTQLCLTVMIKGRYQKNTGVERAITSFNERTRYYPLTPGPTRNRSKPHANARHRSVAFDNEMPNKRVLSRSH